MLVSSPGDQCHLLVSSRDQCHVLVVSRDQCYVVVPSPGDQCHTLVPSCDQCHVLVPSPGDSVGGPHEGRHAVLILHVDVGAPGEEVGNDGGVTELRREVDAGAALAVPDARVRPILDQQHHHTKVTLPALHKAHVSIRGSTGAPACTTLHYSKYW